MLTPVTVICLAVNFVCMKKSTIWILGVIMGLSFLSLLYLQVSYIEEMVKMRRGQFEEGVNRSLVKAVHNLELVETKKYLEKDVIEQERSGLVSRGSQQQKQQVGENVVEHHKYTITAPDGSTYSTFELKTIMSRPANVPKVIISTGKTIPQTSRALQEIVKERFIKLLLPFASNFTVGKTVSNIRARINDALANQPRQRPWRDGASM